MLINFNNSFTAVFSDELPKEVNKIYHLTSNMLPHHLAKFKDSTAQLFIHINRNNVHIRC